MGAGIALVAASSGFDVDVIEPDGGCMDRAKARIAKQTERANRPDLAARINWYAQLQEGSQADVAIEAVPERMDLKRDVFARLAAVLDAHTLLATNTSSLSVTEIAQGVPAPQRVLGLHFFNPPEAMKLVEIVHTADTDDDALERARAIVERFGKVAVIAADTPGFIVNRVARPFYLQAMRAYEAGVAPIEDLDRLARGAGFRMGPFELMDLIGLDVNLATSQSVYERTGEDRFEPIAVQRELVAQNRLGRKTGSGFYDYTNGPPVHDDALPSSSGARDGDERIVIMGYAGIAVELHDALATAYAHVQLWEDEDALDEIPADATIVIDVGDGAADRAAVIRALDERLPPECAIFVDAYATDLRELSKRLMHPQRIVGYGVLAALADQRVVEVVDAEETSDDMLELAQDLFESIGRNVALVENEPGLFLGRTVGSIVNEAVCVVQEEIAGADDVDSAMKLGTNYPKGPIEWGREIGGDRVARILARVAAADGPAFAGSRALWVLDAVQPEEETALTGAEYGG
jgi:3-hydroxybutyryl-CoA dehydrogenase